MKPRRAGYVKHCRSAAAEPQCRADQGAALGSLNHRHSTHGENSASPALHVGRVMDKMPQNSGAISQPFSDIFTNS